MANACLTKVTQFASGRWAVTGLMLITPSLLGSSCSSVDHPPDIVLELTPGSQQQADFHTQSISYGDWSYAYAGDKLDSTECHLKGSVTVSRKGLLVRATPIPDVVLSPATMTVSGGSLGYEHTLGSGDTMSVVFEATCSMRIRVSAEAGQYEG